jgi:hypothetical protein
MPFDGAGFGSGNYRSVAIENVDVSLNETHDCSC